MGLDDLVKVVTYIVRQEDVPLFREVRDQFLKGREVATTLLVISG